MALFAKISFVTLLLITAFVEIPLAYEIVPWESPWVGHLRTVFVLGPILIVCISVFRGPTPWVMMLVVFVFVVGTAYYEYGLHRAGDVEALVRRFSGRVSPAIIIGMVVLWTRFPVVNKVLNKKIF